MSRNYDLPENPQLKGYREKPLLISVLSLVYLLNPLGNLLFVTLGAPVFGLDFSWSSVLDQLLAGNLLAWVNVTLWFSALPLAWGLYQVKLWAWYYFLVHGLLMVLVSFFGSGWAFNPSWVTLVNLLFLIPVGFFLTHEIRTPYFNPRVKWWEQAGRILHSLKVQFAGLNWESYDISEDGLFLKAGEEGLSQTMESGHGITAPLKLDLGERHLELEAHVVRVSPEPQGAYPAGLGLRFLNPDGETRRALRALVQELQATGAVAPEHR